MRLEAEFFDAAAGPALPAPEVGLLVLDFDETLSVADSTSIVISTAIAEGREGRQGAAHVPSCMHMHAVRDAAFGRLVEISSSVVSYCG